MCFRCIFQNYQIKQSLKTPSGSTIVIKNTRGKETTYTFNHLQFNTNYTFDVMARFFKGDTLGKGVTVVKTTGPFSASVGPLQKKVQDNTVILSWSAPRTIDLNKDLKVNIGVFKFSCTYSYLICLRAVGHI